MNLEPTLAQPVSDESGPPDCTALVLVREAVATGAAVPRTRNKAILAWLRAHREDFEADPATTREFVWLQWLETAYSAVDPKERMAALHELSQIPEVALKSPRGGSLAAAPPVHTLSEATQGLLEKLDA